MNPFTEYKGILDTYIYEEAIPFIKSAWDEPHRKYHNLSHLESILSYLNKYKYQLHSSDFDSLVLASFFHDVYYDPKSNVNEDESIKRFIASYKDSNYITKENVIAMIESTKHRKIPKHFLVKIFWMADNQSFYEEYNQLLKNEKEIRKEFNHLQNIIYKKKRIEFLKSNIGLFGEEGNKNINKLIEWINLNY
jgi:predicted metal-dependent HD superfamily phosphohydrolase